LIATSPTVVNECVLVIVAPDEFNVVVPVTEKLPSFETEQPEATVRVPVIPNEAVEVLLNELPDEFKATLELVVIDPLLVMEQPELIVSVVKLMLLFAPTTKLEPELFKVAAPVNDKVWLVPLANANATRLLIVKAPPTVRFAARVSVTELLTVNEAQEETASTVGAKVVPPASVTGEVPVGAVPVLQLCPSLQDVLVPPVHVQVEAAKEFLLAKSAAKKIMQKVIRVLKVIAINLSGLP
jgi:hypothetical protein